MSSIDVLIYAVAVVILTPTVVVLLGILAILLLFITAVLLSAIFWIKEKICKLCKDIKLIIKYMNYNK